MHYLPNTGGLNQNSEHVWDQVKPLNSPKIVTLRGHLLPALGLKVWSLFSCFLTIFGVFYLVAIGNFSMFDIYSSSGVKTAPANRGVSTSICRAINRAALNRAARFAF